MKKTLIYITTIYKELLTNKHGEMIWKPRQMGHYLILKSGSYWDIWKQEMVGTLEDESDRMNKNREKFEVALESKE